MKVVVAGVLCVFLVGACSSHGSGSPRAAAPTASTPPRSETAAKPTTTVSPAQRAVNAQARREVAITACGPNRLHHVEIRGTAHNTTPRVATYAMQLAVIDASGKHFYATAASAGRVAPGQKAEWIADTTAPYVRGMKCSISSVSRRTP